MSDELIKQLNAITRGNLCDPMMISMDDWNAMLASVTEVLGELEQAHARVAEYEALTDEQEINNDN